MIEDEKKEPSVLDKEYKFQLTDREKSDYRKVILDVPIEELDWLIGELLYARAKQHREMQPIKFKICDKCQRTFPDYTINCNLCFSEYLRDIELRHSHNELLDITTR